VTPAAHGRQQTVLAGEPDAAEDVGDAGAASDQGGPPVDHPVMDFAGVFVIRIAGTQEGTAQARFEGLDHRVLKSSISPLYGGDAQLSHHTPPWFGKKTSVRSVNGVYRIDGMKRFCTLRHGASNDMPW
jgi:hypothetical protein